MCELLTFLQKKNQTFILNILIFHANYVFKFLQSKNPKFFVLVLDLLIRIGHDSYIMVRYVYFFLDSLALDLSCGTSMYRSIVLM